MYVNREYGFRFFLPSDWAGYSIRTQILGAYRGNRPEFKFPVITIRDPRWTADTPRQDIPVMVFTRPQWKLVSDGKVTVNSAPVGPAEVGRNKRYVFALPPRYENIDLPGVEEVRLIMRGKPLQAF
jgi:hypothetical protein